MDLGAGGGAIAFCGADEDLTGSLVRYCRMKRALLVFTLLSLCACGKPAAVAVTPAARVLTIVGTNDLHGHLEALPVFASIVRAIRETRGRESVLLLDGGDLFQGTLESNLGEGSAVVSAYDAIGYDAAAIGNHEFDFGPVGPHATPASPDEDPRGALLARSRQAQFAWLSANLVDAKTGALPAWPNLHKSVLLERAGTRVGIIGVSTEDTATTTIAADFDGLRMESIAKALREESQALRSRGATVVVAVGHVGSSCSDLGDPRDTSSCELGSELLRALQDVPRGTIDAFVAGHTHKAVAHYLEGVPVIESFSAGRAFGRIDLVLDRDGHVIESRIQKPTDIKDGSTFEGRVISSDPELAAVIAPALEVARARKEAKVGVVLEAPIVRSYDHESAEGNLFADLMRGAAVGADAAVTNGGGLRANLPAGELSYGALFEAMPFDNRLATVKMKARDLARLIADNAETDKGILSLAGLRAEVQCKKSAAFVTLRREDGRAVEDEELLTVVTSDFLATGGDGARFPKDAVVLTNTFLRDALEQGLRAKGRVSPTMVLDAAHPRIAFTTPRPVRCAR